MMMILLLLLMGTASVSSTESCSVNLTEKPRWFCDFSENDDQLFSPPPKEMPTTLRDSYLRCDSIPSHEFYVDDTNGGKGFKFRYDRGTMNLMVSRFQKLFASTLPPIQVYKLSPQMLLAHSLTQYGEYLRTTITREGQVISSSCVAVFGSMEPWIEAMLVAFGVERVVTFDYNELSFDHPQIQTIKLKKEWRKKKSNATTADEENAQAVDVLEKMRKAIKKRKIGDNDTTTTTNSFNICKNGFDAAISLSSFDHDGLGRYGDNLCPDGDMFAMQEAWNSLKPGGLLFLTLPLGEDALVWNLHRRYGNIRLKLLLEMKQEGKESLPLMWEEVGRLGWNEEYATRNESVRSRSYEPMFILKKGEEASNNEIDIDDNNNSNNVQTTSDKITTDEIIKDSESPKVSENSNENVSINFNKDNFQEEKGGQKRRDEL